VEHAAKLALWEKYASLALAKTLVLQTTAHLLGAISILAPWLKLIAV
jgi:hypothetical protein